MAKPPKQRFVELLKMGGSAVSKIVTYLIGRWLYDLFQ